MRRSTVLLAALLVMSIAAGAQTNLRPGQYEVSMDMDLGIPKDASQAVLGAAGVKDNKRLECYTADELRDFPKAFAREMADEDCKMSDVRTAGNRLTFATTCVSDDIRVTSTTEITFGTDSFTTLTKGTDNQGRAHTIKASARRVGECPK